MYRPRLVALLSILCGVTLLALAPAASAVEGAKQEAETVCTGGTTWTGTARYAEQGQTISCSFTVATGNAAYLRIYTNLADAYVRRGTFQLSGGPTSWTVTPANAAAAGVVYTSAAIAAGSYTLSMTRHTDAFMFDGFTLDPFASDGVAPTAPAVTSASNGGDVVVAWSGATDNVAVTGYRLRRDGGVWVDPVTSPYSDEGMGGDAHVYDIQARDQAGNWSDTATVIYEPSEPCGSEGQDACAMALADDQMMALCAFGGLLMIVSLVRFFRTEGGALRV